MGAPGGNEFWKKRSKHGRDKIFKTPEILKEACEEYLEFTHRRLLNEIDFVGKDATEVIKPHIVPFTISGLCIFLGVNTQYFDDFEDALKPETNKQDKDFSLIIHAIKDIIYTQKFEGAAIGFFQHNIIARDLGLRDVKDINIDANRETIQNIFPTPEELKKDNE